MPKTKGIAQNVNFYAKQVIANWPKLTFSAQNQTTEMFIKKITWKEVTNMSQYGYTFSYKIFNSKWIELKLIKQKLEFWKFKIDALHMHFKNAVSILSLNK